MESTAFDCDIVLTEFLTDYLDGNLTRAEQMSFEEYLCENKEEKEFARKAKKGKNILSHFAEKLDVPPVTA